MRERPLRERKPKKRIEEDAQLRNATTTALPAPAAEREFQEGWRECIDAYALHVPNKRFVGKILEDQGILLEQDCINSPTREHYARYEGYRAALKELRRTKRMR
jgi:hypothetical protein